LVTPKASDNQLQVLFNRLASEAAVGLLNI